MDQVIKEIIANAEIEAKDILSKATQMSREIIAQADLEIKELENSNLEDNNAFIESIRKREISQTNLSARKKIMQAKKEVLDQAFEKAIESIKNLKDVERKKLIKKLFESASKEIDVEYIYCSSGDINLIPLGKHKIFAKDIIGGLILKSKDQSITLDYSYDTIIEDIRKKNLQQISSILF